jgi:putative transposase
MEFNIEESNWHHSPVHRFSPGNSYMVTGATHHKQHFFGSQQKLKMMQQKLFSAISAYGWGLDAWACFSNHYHFVGYVREVDSSLSRLIKYFHSESAKALNLLERTPGRRVWFQYWDKCLTYEASYYARLNYVNNNPVHHGLVAVASQYPFCSASELKRSPAAFRRKLDSFGYDRLKVPDDFEPHWVRV